MANEIIEGNWDELVARPDLHGRKVRMILLDEERSKNPWVASLRAWADSHKVLGHFVDDSRESIYSGTF